MKKSGKKQKKDKKNTIFLLAGLLFVVFGSILFIGAVSGWFGSSKVVIDKEYYSEDVSFLDLDINKYEELIDAKRSFIVFVDQDGCTTADRLREYITGFMSKNGVSVYKMMFSDMKESSLHDFVKYYPSVVLISKGKPVVWLRADSDEDSEMYNNYDAFKKWINKYLAI